jgi:hypothetical protein
MGALKLAYNEEKSPLKIAYRCEEKGAEKVVQRFLSVDPKANEFASWSPYNAFGDNPIRNIDPDGRKFINFDKDGNYIGTTKDNWFHNLFVGSKGRMLDDKGGVTRSFRFADPKNDVKDIQSGVINKLVVVDEKDIQTMMIRSGAYDAPNKTKNRSWGERYDYIKAEGVGGGKLDFSYTQIPNMYPGASSDPLNSPSPMIFLVDDMAHNHMNYGNFLFGAAGQAMGFTETELKLGAHYNSLNLNRNGGNGYDPQLDSPDDQRSIGKGFEHASDNDYDKHEFSIEVGPLEYGGVVPEKKP